MAILLYLYNLGELLPKNSTDLYHHFICAAISNQLSRYDKSLTKNITKLSDLPEQYKVIIQQLSKLSLDALSIKKLAFTLDEIKKACPDIVPTPGKINGLGLLQAVEHFGPHGITLNFIHFTIQEFLAAYYISHLPAHPSRPSVHYSE